MTMLHLHIAHDEMIASIEKRMFLNYRYTMNTLNNMVIADYATDDVIRDGTGVLKKTTSLRPIIPWWLPPYILQVTNLRVAGHSPPFLKSLTSSFEVTHLRFRGDSPPFFKSLTFFAISYIFHEKI